MMFDIIIIGSGPAGLTAGIYTSRASLKTLILAGKKWGGQLMLTTEIENFPGFPDGIMGPELMMNMRKQAEKFGGKIVDKDAVKVDFSKKPFKVYFGTKNLHESSREKISSLMNSKRSSSEPFSSSRQVGSFTKSSRDTKKIAIARLETSEMSTSRKGSFGAYYEAKSIIIATGADTLWLGVPGEQRLIGRGVSSCAPCDAFFFKNKKVIVVGGGDSAMEEALMLTKFASKVIIIHRRDQFRASKIMQEKVFKNPKINILWNTEVIEIFGEDKVTSVKLNSKASSQKSKLQCKIKNEDREVDISQFSGRKIKTIDSHITWQMPIEGIFVAIGRVPKTKIFQGQINLDEKGYVKKCKMQNAKCKINEEYKTLTSVEGVFTAGDVHDYTYKQAITAAGYGTQAALDVEKWLESHT